MDGMRASLVGLARWKQDTSVTRGTPTAQESLPRRTPLMAIYAPLRRAASVYHRHVRTIENWIGAGFIRGYRESSGSILVDLTEIEAALKTNPRMRDGRRPYG